MTDRCPACDAMVLGNEAYCRECAAPLLSHLPPTSARMRWLVWTRSLVLIDFLTAVGPAFLMIVGYTAPVGGTLLAAMGFAVAWAGRRAYYPAAVRLGLIQAGVSSLWVPIIWSLRGVPAIAALSGPVVLAGLAALFIASLCVWKNHPARELRFCCDGCGYSIRGQVVPRCPECGRPFDPVRLPR